jgi:hypothetical protein
MTNKEFIRSNIPAYLVDDGVISAKLERRGASADDSLPSEAAPERKKVDLAYADCLLYVLRLPSSISQGGFSMSNIDKATYEKQITLIYAAYDMLDELPIAKPDITNAGEWN